LAFCGFAICGTNFYLRTQNFRISANKYISPYRKDLKCSISQLKIKIWRKMPAAPFQVVYQEGDKMGGASFLVLHPVCPMMKNLRIYD
jgi:hypothetical protein